MNVMEKFTLEFPLEVTPKLLFTLISTPEGLCQWFAEGVEVQDDVFYFRWEGSRQSARLVHSSNNKGVKFQWLEEPNKDLFLELQVIHESTSTGVSLLVTDYAEAAEMDLSQRLWKTQVGHLQRLFSS
ncbi:MAG: START-like domain-containing protein [Bacteroidales bacterium]